MISSKILRKEIALEELKIATELMFHDGKNLLLSFLPKKRTGKLQVTGISKTLVTVTSSFFITLSSSKVTKRK